MTIKASEGVDAQIKIVKVSENLCSKVSHSLINYGELVPVSEVQL